MCFCSFWLPPAHLWKLISSIKTKIWEQMGHSQDHILSLFLEWWKLAPWGGVQGYIGPNLIKLAWLQAHLPLGFPGGPAEKSACNAEDLGSIPESGRSPGEVNGYPLQYSCLENPMDRGAWQTPRRKESDITEHCAHTHTPLFPKARCPQHLLFREKPWNFLCGIRERLFQWVSPEQALSIPLPRLTWSNHLHFEMNCCFIAC